MKTEVITNAEPITFPVLAICTVGMNEGLIVLFTGPREGTAISWPNSRSETKVGYYYDSWTHITNGDVCRLLRQNEKVILSNS